METKHIHSIKEDDETITIKFGKKMDEEEKSNSETIEKSSMETENKKEPVKSTTDKTQMKKKT